MGPVNTAIVSRGRGWARFDPLEVPGSRAIIAKGRINGRVGSLRRVLHHVFLWVPDLERARESWTWLLGQLGYAVDPSAERVVVLRHPEGTTVALEQSTDMVPGMLYSRMRPGLNHLAFAVPATASLRQIVGDAADRGWSRLTSDRHPLAPGAADVVYLEDRDGFEVELVSLAD